MGEWMENEDISDRRKREDTWTLGKARIKKNEDLWRFVNENISHRRKRDGPWTLARVRIKKSDDLWRFVVRGSHLHGLRLQKLALRLCRRGEERIKPGDENSF